MYLRHIFCMQSFESKKAEIRENYFLTLYYPEIFRWPPGGAHPLVQAPLSYIEILYAFL